VIYKCKNCGGNVIYHPEKKQMFCPYCDSVDCEEEFSDNSTLNCVSCGAPIEMTEFTSACKCQHCGNYMILEERVENEFNPHLVIPFKISKDQAVELLKKEFQARYFTPSSFLTEATLEKLEGMYVPFWLYDYYATYDYEGTGTKVRTWRTGNVQHVETSYYKLVRNMEADFDKIPVDASDAMKDELMDLLEPYDYQALEDFQKKYMSGFSAERYNHDVMELENRAQRKAQQDADKLLQESLTGYQTITASKKKLNLERQTASFALLPVWVYHYSFRGKTYDYHVNGQTGKILGKTPIDAAKVFAYGATIFGSVGIILSLIKMIVEVI